MLVGSFPMSVDSKARVTLPAAFRKEMLEGDSKTLYLVPMKERVDGKLVLEEAVQTLKMKG